MTEIRKTKPLYPARRRLIIVAVIWVLVIRTLVLVGADLLGIPDIWATIINVSLFLAIFTPLSLLAVKELNEARRRGDEPPPQIPTGRSLLALAVITALFWALVFWLVHSTGEFIFPLLPIISTVWLFVNIRRYRRAGDPLETNESTRSS